ncbi:MAG TPA: ABC transporter substrate-binding protein [Candidatus Solibacter sp.]|jgi:branched-chain amino acid transport system substrate-binding protein|nr:ABC transporter substrate-binding protein [Candidatus Solibacter sp.]
MRLKTLTTFLAVLTCMLLATGCAKKGGADTSRIGVITSLTGSQAAFGEAHRNGYLIALDEINAKGGVLGKKVELDFYDDQSKPDQAVQGVSKLVDQDRVPIVLGSYSSESTKAIIPSVTQRQVPLIIPTATADNVMESKSPWIFRICAGAGDYAKATIAFLKDNGDPKTMAIVYENTNFGQANMKAMSAAAKAAGINLVAVESYEAKSPDYKAVLQRVKQANPEVIYFASYLLDAGTLMRQAQEVDVNPKYYTSAGTGFAAAEFPTPKGAGKNAEYTFSVSQWLPDAKWPGSKEFDAEYFKRHNSHPAYHAIQAYESLHVAAQAINDAKSLDSAKIRDAIKNLNLSSTPFGPVKFDANGQNQHEVLITQVQGGKYKVVYPPEVAVGKPIIPAPKWSQR